MIVKRRMPLVVKIILIVLTTLIVVPMIVIGIFMLLSPIYDNIDKSKFEKLDAQSQEIFSQVKAAAAAGEDWTYTAKCEEESTGDWRTTGRYICKTRMATEVQVMTVAEFLALHDKYYPIFDRSYYLKENTALKKEFIEDFGIKFVVSGAAKVYATTAGDEISCTYNIDLLQLRNTDNSIHNNEPYGSEIVNGGKGRVIITLDCRGVGRSDWYEALY